MRRTGLGDLGEEGGNGCVAAIAFIHAKFSRGFRSPSNLSVMKYGESHSGFFLFPCIPSAIASLLSEICRLLISVFLQSYADGLMGCQILSV
jgi:hypothetical protein